MSNHIARVFRGLAPHVQTMWIPEHQELHEDFSAPKMPSRNVMVDVLEDYAQQHGELHIVREQCTNEIYTITYNDWRFLRDGTKAY